MEKVTKIVKITVPNKLYEKKENEDFEHYRKYK